MRKGQTNAKVLMNRIRDTFPNPFKRVFKNSDELIQFMKERYKVYWAWEGADIDGSYQKRYYTTLIPREGSYTLVIEEDHTGVICFEITQECVHRVYYNFGRDTTRQR